MTEPTRTWSPVAFPPTDQDVLNSVSWLSDTSGHTFCRPPLAVAALALPGAHHFPAIRNALAGCQLTQDSLAWVGDSVLGLLATLHCLDAQSPGGASSRRMALVRNTVLGHKARQLSLGIRLFNTGPERVRKEERLATAMEALIGAIFLDSGESLSATRAAAERLGLLLLADVMDA